MAGLGRRVFAAGETLTAGNVQGYLADQAVMAFDSQAALNSAIGTAVSEGMVSYIKDVNAVQVYDGAAWASVIRTNGNFITNSGFDFWTRGNSFSGVAAGTYTCDRWRTSQATATVTRSTDVPDGLKYAATYSRAAGVAGLEQPIESLNSVGLVGQTVTVSFFHKRTGDDGTIRVILSYPTVADNFATVTAIATNNIATTTTGTYTRYSTTFAALPADVANGLLVQIGMVTAGSNTAGRLTGVQLEQGVSLTPFQRQTRSYKDELEVCQRYYQRFNVVAVGDYLGMGWVSTTTNGNIHLYPSVQMRIAPTAIETTGTPANYQIARAATTVTATSLALMASTTNNLLIVAVGVASGLTVGEGCSLRAANAGAYLGFSAELN